MDDRATDNTREIALTRFSEDDIVFANDNVESGQGKSVAITALLQSNCDFLFLLIQGAFLQHGALDTFLSFMQERPDVGVLSPLHCSPGPDRFDAKTMRGYLCAMAPGLIQDAIVGRLESAYVVVGVNSVAWLMRGKMLCKVGGLNRLFFMYDEGEDLIQRLEDRRVTFTLMPRPRIVHQRQSPASPSARSALGKTSRMASRGRSNLIVRLKRPGYSLVLCSRLLVAHGLLRPLVDCLVECKTIEFLAAWQAALKVALQLRVIRRHARQLIRPAAHSLKPASLVPGHWKRRVQVDAFTARKPVLCD